jgi:hypothetical protein
MTYEIQNEAGKLLLLFGIVASRIEKIFFKNCVSRDQPNSSSTSFRFRSGQIAQLIPVPLTSTTVVPVLVVLAMILLHLTIQNFSFSWVWRNVNT